VNSAFSHFPPLHVSAPAGGLPYGATGTFDAAILQSIRAAIIVTDTRGIIRYWNPFAEELYGWSAQEIQGCNVRATVSAGSEAESEERMQRLNTGKPWAGEFSVRCKDGSVVSALVSLSPLLDRRGNTVGIVGVSQDVSGRKRAEEEVRSAQIRLEKQVEDRTRELQLAADLLSDLSARLLQTRDEEARRLSRELHDSVGQLLAALKINLYSVSSESSRLSPVARRALSENEAILGRVISEIRTISHLLHPPLLDEVGLRPALQCFVREFGERSKVAVSLELPESFAGFASEVETSIFRIVQECLTNVHRHSESKTAVIRIHQDERRILVSVHDSGKGIPGGEAELNSKLHSGVGFRGMAERLRYLGGTLDVRSDKNGTIVTATIPSTQTNRAPSGKSAS
jgi:PAS domain S-box-containing protein